MNASTDQISPAAPQPEESTTVSQVFGGIFSWLIDLIQVTKKDMENAGIYLDG